MNSKNILDYVTKGDGCWTWNLGHDGRGYSNVRIAGRVRKVHRLLYELLVAPIPAGKELHHVCENKGCVFPDHLVPVTRSEHLRITAELKGRVTHCKNGHEFSEVNTYMWRGNRTCRKCNIIFTRKRRGVTLQDPAYFDHQCRNCGRAWRSTKEKPKRCGHCGAYVYGGKKQNLKEAA